MRHSQFPPLQHPQCTERVPAARRAEALQFQVRLALVGVLQRPTAVGTPARADDAHGFSETPIARRVDGLEVVERSQDVVVPPRREREPLEFRLDDPAGPVGAKEPVDEEELTRASLRRAHQLHLASAVQLVQPQPLKHADGRMDLGMGCAIPMPAVPPSVRHLLFKQVVGDRVETLVVVPTVGNDGERHAGNTGLASVGSSEVHAPIWPKPVIEEKRARPLRLLVGWWQAEIAQQQHGVRRRCPLGIVQATSPGTLGVLPGEQTSATPLTRYLSPLPLNGAFLRPEQIAQDLPPNCRVTVEKPSDHIVAVACHCWMLRVISVPSCLANDQG